jgi:hypothetical protein
MDPDRWRQVDLLLEEALELPQEERSSFLDCACAQMLASAEMSEHCSRLIKSIVFE